MTCARTGPERHRLVCLLPPRRARRVVPASRVPRRRRGLPGARQGPGAAAPAGGAVPPVRGLARRAGPRAGRGVLARDPRRLPGADPAPARPGGVRRARARRASRGADVDAACRGDVGPEGARPGAPAHAQHARSGRARAPAQPPLRLGRRDVRRERVGPPAGAAGRRVDRRALREHGAAARARGRGRAGRGAGWAGCRPPRWSSARSSGARWWRSRAGARSPAASRCSSRSSPSRTTRSTPRRGSSARSVELRYRGATNYPLSLTASAPGLRLTVRAAYDRRRFTDDAVARLLEQLGLLLEGLASDPRAPLALLPLVTPLERQKRAGRVERHAPRPRLSAHAARGARGAGRAHARTRWRSSFEDDAGHLPRAERAGEPARPRPARAAASDRTCSWASASSGRWSWWWRSSAC